MKKSLLNLMYTVKKINRMFKVLKRMTTRLNQEGTLHKRKGLSRKYTLKTQSRGGEMAQQCLLCFQRIRKQFDSQQPPQVAQIRKKQTPLFLKTEKKWKESISKYKEKRTFYRFCYSTFYQTTLISVLKSLFSFLYKKATQTY